MSVLGIEFVCEVGVAEKTIIIKVDYNGSMVAVGEPLEWRVTHMGYSSEN